MKDVNILKSNGVDVDAGLQYLGDMATYNSTLEFFLETIGPKVAELSRCKEANDMPNYAIQAHTLKSDAKYFGFTALSEHAYEHEMKAKANNMYYVFDHYNELINEINRILHVIDEYLGKTTNKFATNTPEKAENLNKKTILVADDSNIIKIFFEKVFKDEYRIIYAADGKAALDAVAREGQKISAMLLDLNMPNFSGIDVLEYFKNNFLFNKIPVVIITGEDSGEIISQAAGYPIVEILTKPFNERDIKRVVEKALEYGQIM